MQVDDLRRALASDEYDMLVLSAHGMRRGNSTALKVGNSEVLFDQDLGRVPPIVCLSACQVAPRGAGTVNVSDLFFRQGAIVVLGTLVPVDVRRNATLMTRLFVNMAATLRGELKFRTLEEVWRFTSISNAVHDILSASRRSSEWAYKVRNGVWPIKEFMDIRVAERGGIHLSNVYSESEQILQDIADDWGVGAWFRSWIRNQGYVPESLFYAMLGWPDRIILGEKLPGVSLPEHLQ